MLLRSDPADFISILEDDFILHFSMPWRNAFTAGLTSRGYDQAYQDG